MLTFGTSQDNYTSHSHKLILVHHSEFFSRLAEPLYAKKEDTEASNPIASMHGPSRSTRSTYVGLNSLCTIDSFNISTANDLHINIDVSSIRCVICTSISI